MPAVPEPPLPEPPRGAPPAPVPAIAAPAVPLPPAAVPPVPVPAAAVPPVPVPAVPVPPAPLAVPPVPGAPPVCAELPPVPCDSPAVPCPPVEDFPPVTTGPEPPVPTTGLPPEPGGRSPASLPLSEHPKPPTAIAQIVASKVFVGSAALVITSVSCAFASHRIRLPSRAQLRARVQQWPNSQSPELHERVQKIGMPAQRIYPATSPAAPTSPGAPTSPAAPTSPTSPTDLPRQTCQTGGRIHPRGARRRRGVLRPAHRLRSVGAEDDEIGARPFAADGARVRLDRSVHGRLKALGQ